MPPRLRVSRHRTACDRPSKPGSPTSRHASKGVGSPPMLTHQASHRAWQRPPQATPTPVGCNGIEYAALPGTAVDQNREPISGLGVAPCRGDYLARWAIS